MIQLLTTQEENKLLQCSNFYDLIGDALGQLEQDDYYRLSIPLRDLQSILNKLVTNARADIYSKRLKTINKRLDERGEAADNKG